MKGSVTTLLLLVLATALAAVPSFAGVHPPLTGTYKTLDYSLLPGRSTESSACPGCLNQPDNMIEAESWNGSTLAGQWKVSCAKAGNPMLLLDDVVDGNGQRMYRTSYVGGTLWLSGSGPWGTGDPQYTGTLGSFTVVSTQQIVNGQIAGIVVNVNFSGALDGYDNCFDLAIANAELVGVAPAAPAIAGPFPAFVGPSDCNATGTYGSYWDVHDITFTIRGQCAVSARQPTWGQIKSLYR